MEEAEALATNVAIIGTKMLAAGTLTSLQQRHGGAFSVRAVRVSKASINLADGEEVRLVEERASEEVERCIKEAFNGRVRGYEDRHGQISFLLPHEREQLGEIMQTMEGFKGDNIPYGDDGGEDGASYSVGGVGGSAVQEKRSLRLLSDYTITGPTLEEVFMNVARESGAEGGV
jgi:ATP-binding cassette subfamily A (ABC1) protein 3